MGKGKIFIRFITVIVSVAVIFSTMPFEGIGVRAIHGINAVEEDILPEDITDLDNAEDINVIEDIEEPEVLEETEDIEEPEEIDETGEMMSFGSSLVNAAAMSMFSPRSDDYDYYGINFTPTEVYTRSNIPNSITGEYVLIDFSSEPSFNINKVITISNTVKVVKFIGNQSATFTDLNIIVEGETDVVLHNFNYIGGTSGSALKFNGTDPAVIALGSNNLISGRGNFDTITAAGDLFICGNADLAADHVTPSTSSHSGRTVISVVGALSIDIDDTNLKITAGIGRDGANGSGSGGGRGGDGGNGGNGIIADSLDILRNSNIYIVAGAGGRGGNGGKRTDSSGSGGNGGHGGNGGTPITAREYVESKFSYLRLTAGKGGNGGNGGNGDHGKIVACLKPINGGDAGNGGFHGLLDIIDGINNKKGFYYGGSAGSKGSKCCSKAKSNGNSGTTHPSISDSFLNYESDRKVKDITINKTSTEITLGSWEILVATIEPDNAKDRRFTWSSDDESVATVENGEVKGINYGTANITVTAADGGFQATCTVIVTDKIIPIEKIELNKTEITLIPGTTEILEVTTIEPANSTSKAVIWESDNEDIVTVNNNGLVAPTSVFGNTFIKVTADDAVGVSVLCDVFYKPQQPQVKIDRDNILVYTDADCSATFSWEITGLSNIATEVEIAKNNDAFIKYPSSGDSITFDFPQVSGLKDIYTLRITATNEFDDISSDDITFEVYNSKALSQEFNNSIVIDNTGQIAGKMSDEILEIRNELPLTHSIQLDTSNFDWTSADGLKWEVADGNIAEVYQLLLSGWSQVSPDTALSPTTPIRIVGLDNGTTILKVTHEKTGMFIDIPVTVNTLKDKLHIIRTNPAETVQVTYTNGNNQTKTVSTNASGEVAIYEPDGISSDVTFKAINGDDTWIGTIRQENLISGESFSGLYPVNQPKLTLLSNITLFLEKSTGGRYHGDIQLTGGLFRNDIFIPSSEIKSLQYNNSTDTSGRIFIQLDTDNFGALNSQDKYKYVFEIRFLDGDYAPMLIEIDAEYNVMEALQSNAFTLFINEWDEVSPSISYWYNGKNVTNQKTNVGLSNEAPAGQLRVYAALPDNKNINSAQVRSLDGTLVANQNSIISSYPFLTDISYAEIIWNLNSTTIPAGTTQSFSIEFEYADGKKQTEKMPFGISNAIALQAKADEAAFLKIPISASVLTTHNLDFARKIPFIPQMPRLNIDVKELDFNVRVEATNDPTRYKLYGYIGEANVTIINVWSSADAYTKVKNEIISKKYIDDGKSRNVGGSETGSVSVDIGRSTTGLKAYVEGELKWNHETEEFEMIIIDGDMIGGASLSIGISFSFSPIPLIPPLQFQVGVESGIEAGFDMEIMKKSNEVLITNNFIIYDKLFAGPKIDTPFLKGGIDVWAKTSYGLEYGSRYDVMNRTARQATRYMQDIEAGVDAWGWTGAEIKVPSAYKWGVKLKKKEITLLNLRYTLWKTPRVVLLSQPISGDQSIWTDQALKTFAEPMGISSTSAVGLIDNDFAMMPMSYSFELEMEAEIAGDESFSVFVWEESLEQQNNGAIDDAHELTEIEELIDYLNNLEIAVVVYDGEGWSDIHYLTANSQSNVCPIIAIDMDEKKAVVAWQRQALRSNGDFIDITTELWYSIYENGIWSESAFMDFVGEDAITNYQIVMNDNGFAIVTETCSDDLPDVSNVIAYFADWSGNITKNTLTNSNALCINSQIAKTKDEFYISWYQYTETGNDIILRKMFSDGTIDNLNMINVNEVSVFSALNPTMSYQLVSDENQAAIICRAYDFEIMGDAIYAIKVSEKSGKMALSAPMTVVEPRTGYGLEIIGGELSGNLITVIYNAYEEPESDEDEIFLFSDDITKEFENSFADKVAFDDLSIGSNNDLLTTFSIMNTGIDAVDSVEIKIGGQTYFSDNRTITPGAFAKFEVILPLGDALGDLGYSISVQFANGETQNSVGTLALAKPNVSIGRITTLSAEKGIREFSVNLFNDSDVPLKGSGYEVRLSFYADPSLNNPITVEGQTSFTSNEDMELLDKGGLNIHYLYTVPIDELEVGEIPDLGVWLYILAEIWDGDEFVEQRSYVANQTALGFNSLIRHGEPAQIVVAQSTSDGFIGTTADLQIMNRSMQSLKKGAGKIKATLYDDDDDILETRSMRLGRDLLIESTAVQNIQFKQMGAYVLAEFEFDGGFGIEYGNVKNYSTIDYFDVSLLLQYLAGWNVDHLINFDNADVDSDGMIDYFDATLILQYLAGWPVTMGP